MAKVAKAKKNTSPKRRVSSLKPGLRGARNMMAAQMRASTHSPAAAMRFWAGVLFLIFVTIFGALWLGGYLPQLKQAGADFKRDRLISMGFVVDRVDVMGEGRLVEDDVRTALQIYQGQYFFEADLKAAKARVESLSWVDHALVRRLWPNRVVVQIIERKPYALWQNDGRIQLIDAKGTVISDADPARFAGLDLIVGRDADKAAPQFQAQLSQFPVLSSRAEAFIYVNESRWDILLNDRQTLIKLPADDPATALARLNELQLQHRVLDRDIGVIDLRLTGRIILTPGQAPKERA
jgi:cell division protein FtsQ